jgi:hypothetical protein
MRRNMFGVLLATIVLLPLAGPGPAQAQEQTPCSFKFDAEIEPGLSNAGSSGTHDSKGETGTVDCKGKVNGKTVTGPGRFGNAGRYGTADPDTCTSGGEGDGTMTMTVPTSDGTEQATATYTFTYGALQNGILAVTFNGEQWSGTAEVRPTKGDCVRSALTRMTVDGKGTFTS